MIDRGRYPEENARQNGTPHREPKSFQGPTQGLLRRVSGLGLEPFTPIERRSSIPYALELKLYSEISNKDR